ncbi:MAG TPA: hypothetical protein VN796_03420 [Acidimicrobiales bacterium]|nr:hypothetical protein [Acidimicrobiales bacterium]
MRKRIVGAGVVIVAVLGGVGGTVAALGHGSSAHGRDTGKPAVSVAHPATAAVTAVTSVPNPAAAPVTVPTTPATTVPAPETASSAAPPVARTTTTTLAPAIGAPGGSRFGPTGSPAP